MRNHPLSNASLTASAALRAAGPLPDLTAAAQSHTVNDLSTLPDAGEIEAAGSVADISTSRP